MADEAKKETKVSANVEKLIKTIGELSVMELADLVKALEEKFGVSAIAAAPVAVAPATAGAAAPAAEEKTTFTVVLKADGGKKIQVLKAVRELIPDLNLLDAKKLVESLPKELMKDIKKEAADEAQKKLTDAGAEVEIK